MTPLTQKDGLRWRKYKFSIHNISFASEKVILSESREKYTQIKDCLQAKQL